MPTKTATRAANRGPTMTDEHKAALAEGREQGRAVRAYLEALEHVRPRRGRPRSPERTAAQLEEIVTRLANGADPLARLFLNQKKMDLEAELASMEAGDGADMESLEENFIAVAAAYSGRRGLTYSAWRECGVPASVLQRAGITRSG